MRDDSSNRRPLKRGALKYLKLSSDREVSFSDALSQAKRAHRQLSRWLSYTSRLTTDRVDSEVLSEYDEERLENFVEALHDWVDAWERELEKRRTRRATQERIESLRQVDGRTPEEAAAFLSKADQLERRLAD